MLNEALLITITYSIVVDSWKETRDFLVPEKLFSAGQLLLVLPKGMLGVEQSQSLTVDGD